MTVLAYSEKGIEWIQSVGMRWGKLRTYEEGKDLPSLVGWLKKKKMMMVMVVVVVVNLIDEED